VRAGGPASESLKGTKPRDGERPAPRGRYGDLALGGAARDGGDCAFADDARASDGPGIGRSGQAGVSEAGRRATLVAASGSGANEAAPGEILGEQRSVTARAGAARVDSGGFGGEAARTSAAGERLDDAHASAAAGTDPGHVWRRGGFGAGRGVACVGFGARPSGRVGGRDQVPQAPDGCGASGAGEEAVMADAVSDASVCHTVSANCKMALETPGCQAFLGVACFALSHHMSSDRTYKRRLERRLRR